MSIYKSRQVNLDPEPWVAHDPDGCPTRWEARDSALTAAWARDIEHDPRPEFEPTRDPLPWVREVWSPYDLAWIVNARLAEGLDFFPLSLGEKFRLTWAPRREQFDTPVNWVLWEVRLDVQANEVSVEKAVGDALQWLNLHAEPRRVEGVDGVMYDLTVEMIEHARKVLTRLAGWSA